MITKDLHTHTVYSDGANTPEEMVLAALAEELDTIGISDHSYTAFDTSYCMKEEDIPRYLSELRYLRAAYYDRIHVLCGIEQDYYSDCPTDDYDYVIGSVHYLRCGEDYVPVDESPEILEGAVEKYFGGDIYALCEAYYQTVADVVKRTGCDIIGHFDLVMKFNENSALFDAHDPRYVAAWQAAADALLPYGVPFEINTGAVARGYRTQPYPSDEIAAYILDRGGRLVLSSDAHCVENVAYGFDEMDDERLTEKG